jgi:hypothetical protein
MTGERNNPNPAGVAFDVPAPTQMGAGYKQRVILPSPAARQGLNMCIGTHALSEAYFPDRQEAGRSECETNVGVQGAQEFTGVVASWQKCPAGE